MANLKDTKGALRLLALLTALLMVLAACGDGDGDAADDGGDDAADTTAAPADDGGDDAADTTAAPADDGGDDAADTTAAPADDGEPYRVALIYPGTADDLSWSNAWFDGAEIAMANNPNIEVESVELLNDPDAVLQQGSAFAGQGFDFIMIAHGGDG